MSERATLAAIVLLLAAGGLMQATSPAVQALVGVYVAVSGGGASAVRHLLTLDGNATATVRTVSASSGDELSVASGSWIANGATIQLTLADLSDPAGATAVMLEQKDGALVVADLEGRRSRFAGLTFARADGEPRASGSK